MKFADKRTSRLMRMMDWLLWKSRINLNFKLYWTTWGDTVYPPVYINRHSSTWKKRYAIDIAHESVHVRQFAKLGKLLFSLIYLTPYGRWVLERDAYCVNIAAAQNKGEKINDVVHQLSTNYFYPWPEFLMRRWFCKKFHISIDRAR